MPRTDLKTRTPLGSAIDNEIFKRLKEYSKESHIPISKILDLAIADYLNNKK